MVLEALIKSEDAEKHPMMVFLLGALYASIAIVFELWIFRGAIDSLFVFIIVFASIPLMHKIIVLEEKKEKYYNSERGILKEHKKALRCFISLFLGVLLALTLWFSLLPETTVQEVFSSQIDEVTRVQERFSGRAVMPGTFGAILANNLKVLLFSIIFSFFFGSGAIFILTWNASLISVAVGTFVREAVGASTGMLVLPAFIGSLSYGFAGYMIHGLLEVLAYFTAGLAGGIISVAAIKHELFSKESKKIINDALWLVLLSVGILLVSVIIETYITPVFF